MGCTSSDNEFHTELLISNLSAKAKEILTDLIEDN